MQIGVGCHERLFDLFGRHVQRLTRRLEHLWNFEPSTNGAYSREIVTRAEAGAGSMLAVFIGRKAIVWVDAMLIFEIGRRGVVAHARLGVRTIFVVGPQAVDDEAVARAFRAFWRRGLLAAQIAEARRP